MAERRLNIRVPYGDYIRLAQKAEVANLPVSTYVRKLALGHRIKPGVPPINSEAWISLGKALSNLNQITRAMNVAVRAKETEREALKVEVDELRHVIRQVRERLIGLEQ